jgi:mRNA interferase RelE/StbE
MAYRIEFSSSAANQLRRLPRTVQGRLTPHIDALAETPRPPGVKKLSDDTYRIRVGEYRVIYDIADQVLIVLVLSIGHRREVYRRRR